MVEVTFSFICFIIRRSFRQSRRPGEFTARISVQVESRILTLNSPGATAGYISTRGCSW